ncbi:transcript variant X2 [Nothobranchius furzeri]|uniref:Transcript variant X1 n=3 Tax=Nothobranchius furzeri TaxID=105023 RepID=A0A9D2YB38_NOTFU|nr:transcript variant X1 [Nothobranchius furzeri]KAF7217341.1 transcript variant X2 [Nothobranchius furzeri]
MFDTPKISFKMVDVGGMRSKRRKWVFAFEHVTSIIFLVAISEYDQVMFETDSVNRLVESLHLFQTIIYSTWLEEASTILFLNKTDLLEEKITHSHLVTYFPDYNGPPGDAESAKKFIHKKFVDAHTGHHKPLHMHFTCTTDTDNIRVVFRAVRPALIHHSLEKFRVE